MGTETQKKTRKIHCANCGEFIGEYPHDGFPADPESCGAPECNREVRDIFRQQDDEARENARDDDYARYR